MDSGSGVYPWAAFYDYTALKMVQICAISVARRFRMRRKRRLKIRYSLKIFYS
jgi:hypothetical protein